MRTPKLGERLQCLDRFDRVVRRHDDDGIVRSCSVPEALAQPGIENRLEREVGLVAVHDRGAGIDASLNGVALQDGQAEAVDRRRREFTQTGSCVAERFRLFVA